MTSRSRAHAAGRERTLLAALLLSSWGPLATGAAVLSSRSTTQLADFIRRSVELIALAVSWWVFRSLARRPGVSAAEKSRLEGTVGLGVAAAMICSGIALLTVALSRTSAFAPGGNVYPGLAIAALGLATNAWFWRRYAHLEREQHNRIIAAQIQLYRAKAFVDLCVIAALAAVAFAPAHRAARWVDLLGSLAVALYLIWSGVRTARNDGKARPAAPPSPGPRRSSPRCSSPSSR
jgi:divalent metal cation (Fe/Co/Zn/Cd) transporter